MKQKRVKRKFGLVIAIFILLFVLTVISFPLPFSNYDFMGFIGAFNKSLDYNGGTLINYSVTDNSGTNEDLSIGINANLTRIKNLLINNNYDCNTYINGDYIAIELVKDYSPLNISQIINADYEFYISSDEDGAEKLVTSENVEDSYGAESSGNIGLYISFNEDGATAIQNATSSATSSSAVTLYFTIADKTLNVSVSSAITQDYIFITLSSLDLAKSYGSTIVASKFDYSFTEISTSTVTAKQALINTICSISVAVAFVGLGVALLIVLNKKLGLIGSFVLCFATIMHIVLFQAIPNLIFSSYTFAGFVLTFVLGLFATLFLFNSMHNEYKIGKKLYASVKFGFDKSFAKIIDMFVITLLVSVMFFAFGSYELKGFAIALTLGSVVYALCILLLNKWFSGWYLVLNPTDNKKYGFIREENVNELE